MKKLIIPGLLMILSGGASAQLDYEQGIYRWVDTITGEVHYSRYPPAHITDYEEIEQTYPALPVSAGGAGRENGGHPVHHDICKSAVAKLCGHNQLMCQPRGDVSRSVKQGYQ